MRWLLVGVAAVMLAACGGAPAPTVAETHDIQGSLNFLGVINNGAGLDKCIGSNTATLAGAEVDLTDGAGVTLGVAHLAEAPDSGTGPDTGNSLYTCHDTFTFTAVKKADFYKVSLGGVAGPTYSYDDLAKANWTIALHL